MSEVESRPGSSMTPERRIGVTVSVALILGGGWWAASQLTQSDETKQLEFPVSGTSLRVETSNNDIEIRTADVSKITVTRKAERNVFSDDPEENYEDGVLELKKTGCGFLSFGGCDTNYLIQIPKDLAVKVETSSGEILAIGLEKGADLKTSSGRIELHTVSGDITAESSSGDIEGQTLGEGQYRANSSSGEIGLEFARAPVSVDAETSSGEVKIELPGADTYAVDVKTNSGETDNRLKQDPAATRKIRAKSSSGDVKLQYAGP
ncbi:DUF4097 domain-containing protein [Kribbella sp. NBC_01245]|uniref:DUF4097 family beta strand repeat-containing protein n=1 Tax=Kribbella sp. NBC_01245 TaxID=2903578 RepID=UPI002E28489D|nr:DUF4097 family beta strand repeat-containing protein [Kribbella sp. NBC_01245]